MKFQIQKSPFECLEVPVSGSSVKKKHEKLIYLAAGEYHAGSPKNKIEKHSYLIGWRINDFTFI